MLSDKSYVENKKHSQFDILLEWRVNSFNIYEMTIKGKHYVITVESYKIFPVLLLWNSLVSIIYEFTSSTNEK